MSNRLSHSSVTTYQRCPKSWHFHYRERLRPKFQTSALAFGTAVDRATAAILQPKEGNDPHVVFEYEWSRQEVNGVSEELAESTKLVYSNSEFDYDLLSKEDIEYIEKRQKELGLTYLPWLDLFETILQQKKDKGIGSLTEKEHKFLSLCNWLSLRKKGHLFVDAFITKVMPKIKQVLAVQKEIKLKNEDGDEIIGFADIVAEVEGYGVVVLDVKTSAINYDPNAVLQSPQLSLYVHALSEEYCTRSAGYIVMLKRIIKNKKKVCSKCGEVCKSKARSCDVEIDGVRCKGEFIETIDPEVAVQFLINEIPQQTEDIVLENFDFINTAIKNESFHRNLQSCETNFGLCPYFGLCYKGDMTELVKLEEKKNE